MVDKAFRSIICCSQTHIMQITKERLIFASSQQIFHGIRSLLPQLRILLLCSISGVIHTGQSHIPGLLGSYYYSLNSSQHPLRLAKGKFSPIIYQFTINVPTYHGKICCQNPCWPYSESTLLQQKLIAQMPSKPEFLSILNNKGRTFTCIDREQIKFIKVILCAGKSPYISSFNPESNPVHYTGLQGP